MPITGLPLPFISSGRTFMVVLVSALIQLVIALPVWLIRKLMGR